MVTMRQIRSLARHIAREFRPQRIILFGSHAYGTPTADSDVDLLVVTRFRGPDYRLAADIVGRVRPSFPLDVIVRSPAEIARRVKQKDFFLMEVMVKGVELYAAPPR